MQFCFYLNHEHACPDVGHCPHLGGAALRTLVLSANQSGTTIDGLHRTIDAERKRNAELAERNQKLAEQLAQAKLELKLERQNKFATSGQDEEDQPDEGVAADGDRPTSRRNAARWWGIPAGSGRRPRTSTGPLMCLLPAGALTAARP